jgi:hypothetical protein
MIIVVLAAGMVAVASLRFLAQKFARVSMEALRSADRRDPILFLRSFTDDRVRLRSPRRSPLRWVLRLGEPRPWLDHVLLEEATPIGPVIAIGAPDRSPPFGIARTFASNEDWQPLVSGLMAQAQVIVLTIDKTEGISWEIENVFSHGWTPKSLYLLPPRYTSPVAAAYFLSSTLGKMNASDELSTKVHAFFRTHRNRCVGWFLGSNETIEVMTTEDCSDVAYILALRLFIREKRLMSPANAATVVS